MTDLSDGEGSIGLSPQLQCNAASSPIDLTAEPSTDIMTFSEQQEVGCTSYISNVLHIGAGGMGHSPPHTQISSLGV